VPKFEGKSSEENWSEESKYIVSITVLEGLISTNLLLSFEVSKEIKFRKCGYG